MLSVIVTTFNGAHCAVPCIASLSAMASSLSAIELIVVDNGSTDGVADEVFRYNQSLNVRVIRLAENVGHNKAACIGVKESVGENIAIVHSDLLMLEKGWDGRVNDILVDLSIGIIGVFGAAIATADGGRGDCWSNLVCAEQHGQRSYEIRRVILLDSMFVACRRKMWNMLGEYDYKTFPGHHFADKDLMMKANERSYENWLLPLYCHHFGQIASTSPDPTAKRFSDMHDKNSRKYVERWKDHLPAMLRIPGNTV